MKDSFFCFFSEELVKGGTNSLKFWIFLGGEDLNSVSNLFIIFSSSICAFKVFFLSADVYEIMTPLM